MDNAEVIISDNEDSYKPILIKKRGFEGNSINGIFIQINKKMYKHTKLYYRDVWRFYVCQDYEGPK